MKRDKNALIAGCVAILAGILIITGACMGDKFPKILWILTAVLQFVNAGWILKRSREVGKNSEADSR